VYEIDPLQDLRWARLVGEDPRASVFHSTKWLGALQTVYDYKPVVITTCGPEGPLTNGIVFCRIHSWLTGNRIVSLPFSDHCEPLVGNVDELSQLLAHMRRYVESGKWRYAEMRPMWLHSDVETAFGESTGYLFHRLDLRASAQQLFRNFHKDCVQRKIRRAEKEKLEYREGVSEELLQQFYSLLVMTRRRQYLPPQPIRWFRSLMAEFEKDLKIRVASKDGLPIASILTLSHKKSMVYKYGCSDAAFNRLGGTALLFWKTIQQSQESGIEEFDLGRTDKDNVGLSAFKEHWGAERLQLHYWTYPHAPNRPVASWKKALAGIVVTASPDLALKTVGKMLYRHAG
jgi:Acetyltransferase (GNAT) domain